MCSPTSEDFFDAQKRKEREPSLLEQKIKKKRERKYIRDIIGRVSNNEPKITEIIMKGKSYLDELLIKHFNFGFE